MSDQKIALGSDHAGYVLKQQIRDYLVKEGYEPVDYGTDSEDSTDYPDHIHPLAGDIDRGTLHRGIILCGSGNGVSMTANKYQGVRAALCWTPVIARLARAHNDANILALPARHISKEDALEAVRQFLNTPFEGGRHQKRVLKIQCPDR